LEVEEEEEEKEEEEGKEEEGEEEGEEKEEEGGVRGGGGKRERRRRRGEILTRTQMNVVGSRGNRTCGRRSSSWSSAPTDDLIGGGPTAESSLNLLCVGLVEAVDRRLIETQ